MLDILLKNGKIYSGDGSKAYNADIGIKNKKIKLIKPNIKVDAKNIIDVKDNIIAPGFIDMHAHDDINIFSDKNLLPKLKQGITTVVNGNCGLSFYPISNGNKKLLLDYLSKLFPVDKVKINWNSFEEYVKEIEKNETSLNLVNLIGHGSLRIAVMGFDDRSPTESEMKEMERLLEKLINGGVYGLSTGLLYPPGSYADSKEIKRLCKIIAKNNLLYSTHMRNESNEIRKSVEENIEIAKEIGVKVNISHFKVSGKNNWGKSEELLELIDKARSQGLKITCDQYPYKAGSTMLTAVLPQWALNKGSNYLIEQLKHDNKDFKKKIKDDIENGIEGWDNLLKEVGPDNIIINSFDNYASQDLIAKSLQEISEYWDLDLYQTLFNILVKENAKVSILVFQGNEEDLLNILKSPFVMFGTDGLSTKDRPHPRMYGSYAKILEEYVKNKKEITLEQAFRKMSYLPAKTLALKKRGLIEKGYYADLVVIDYDSLKDNADYKDPVQFPDGIEMVIVNGKIALKDGEVITTLPGKVLKP
jgi:N-acyl-D-amino-acid deacylase